MTDPTLTTPVPVAPKRRRWPWILAIVAALFLGVGIGAAAPADDQPATAASEPAKQSGALPKPDPTFYVQPELSSLQAQVESLTDERDTLQATVDDQTARIAELEAAPAPEPEPVEEEPADGTYTAGDYTFADVQVREDGVGDFEVRARVTNGGGSVEYATWTATLFADGTVVGDAMGIVDSIDTDETVTVTFISTDDYGDWDSVEFQVDSEW